jgi:V-type H+-transporting ATPase 16kDa proteolipid subunit
MKARLNSLPPTLLSPANDAFHSQCLIPVVMSGIIAVYSLVVSVLIAQDLVPPSQGNHYSLYRCVLFYPPSKSIAMAECWLTLHLACGLSVGFSGIAAGYCIGMVGEHGVRAYMQQTRLFVGMVLILIFGEVLGLYGCAVMLAACNMFPANVSSLIVALILNTRSKG